MQYCERSPKILSNGQISFLYAWAGSFGRYECINVQCTSKARHSGDTQLLAEGRYRTMYISDHSFQIPDSGLSFSVPNLIIQISTFVTRHKDFFTHSNHPTSKRCHRISKSLLSNEYNNSAICTFRKRDVQYAHLL